MSYIELEALVQEINRQMRCSKNSIPRRSFAVGDVLNCIYTAPAADVAPVRHGRWIDDENNPIPWDEYNPNCPLYSAYCSECGEWLTGSDELAVIGLYCPNCGALMTEAEHEAS